jgi:hypothetical protein
LKIPAGAVHSTRLLVQLVTWHNALWDPDLTVMSLRSKIKSTVKEDTKEEE